MTEPADDLAALEEALRRLEALVVLRTSGLWLAFANGLDEGAHRIGRPLGVRPRPGEAALIIPRACAAL
jgi:hypothetical protein